MASDFERPKRNWREIDQNKDRSKHRQEDRPAMQGQRKQRADSASKQYKAGLERLFDSGGSAPSPLRNRLSTLTDSADGVARRAAMSNVLSARTSSERTTATRALLEMWALPTDSELLTEVLACDDEDLIEMALDVLAGMLSENRIGKRTSLLEQRLRSVISLCEEESIVEKARELADRLRGIR